jgi:hypothetical protein
MKEEWSYWKIGLPADSEALADLDDLCKKTGLQRAEVSRLLLLTWSAARRGKINEMWGFSYLKFDDKIRLNDIEDMSSKR